MKFSRFSILLVVALVLGLSPVALADTIEITPDSGVLNTSRWEGNETSQAAINTAISGIISPSVELYKDNVGTGEEGPLASSYAVTYNGDLSGGTIVYTGGDIVGPTAYLLVKDGNASPGWYLFNLTLLGWNGTDQIEMSGFWPSTGAISHVTLYGTRGTSVPEPASLILLGAGLLGMGLLRRKSS